MFFKKKRFTKPTLQELKSYCNEFALNIDPQQFIDYYEANGWKINKNPMKDWQATASKARIKRNLVGNKNYVLLHYPTFR